MPKDTERCKMIHRFLRPADNVTKHDFRELEWFSVYTSPDQQRRLEQELRAMPYEEFLKSFYWRAVKAYFLSFMGAYCRECRRKGIPLDVHHTSYEHHGNEHRNLEDLKVLCRECHGKRHGVLKVPA
jgi:5-methylcytosine-specific restriction endonuclease McrA